MRVALLLAILAPAALHSQRIAGVVRDSAGQPVPVARVQLASTKGSVAADDQGRFTVAAPAGAHTLTVRRIGYWPLQAGATSPTDSADVRLLAVPRQLEATVVHESQVDRKLARRGFHERMLDRERGAGAGEFITPEEIEHRKPQKLTQILTGKPGVRMGSHGRDHQVPISASGNCALAVYLDGARFQTSGDYDGLRAGSSGGGAWALAQQARGGRGELGAGEGIDRAIPMTHVVAIEIYTRGATVPSQFQLTNGTCGVIAIWTRS